MGEEKGSHICPLRGQNKAWKHSVLEYLPCIANSILLLLLFLVSTRLCQQNIPKTIPQSGMHCSSGLLPPPRPSFFFRTKRERETLGRKIARLCAHKSMAFRFRVGRGRDPESITPPISFCDGRCEDKFGVKKIGLLSHSPVSI